MKPTDSSARRVFVIDDDVAVLNSLKFALGVDGYDVSVYPSGTAFLDGAQAVDGGCVVIDYRLPDMTGLDLADALRARGITAPLILITTHPSLDVRRRAATEGIRIVEKPLIPGFLHAAIRSALASRSARASSDPTET